MEQYIIAIIEEIGYLGVFLLIAVENFFPPIPSEIILTFSGFMTTKSNITLEGVILSATAGSVVGAIVLYKIGQLLGALKFNELVERYGRVLRIKGKDVDRAYLWFEKYENKTVFLCRMVPLLRSLISIPAGISKMKFSSFLLLTTAGSLIWNIVLIGAGAILGDKWQQILGFLDVYSKVVVILLALFIFVFFIYLFTRRKKA
ncbi:alkaline phosphatase-like protein [Clostridium pasteurianum DSM 525 = ATCC 6013]|uniref:Alkaline phosphatase-like protein n=1 Tax=Clostridium pasteurianum DSM 525 = ATCC 6013 TaxID=1262449 RepID=A0A0H3JAC6_CLOPA|nr:DedA family protein [Clostridium pasteurianum]AJA48445.1 alkaline phosphatase-like protein [Clostridium pasteurianum DSM 525 = ATCC 6013]AJA52433.1 alkaline phosphatase-like protein [Clostridium pasteurianum DSM 525 = ATCC 6013]AOZ75689.1 alkaline phosphatase [Clostridium pasteurianum DSM 525 = ATCC 6013]AOZ79485.1 alkaline phosphatase [Clostridium pasteurianum]ELP60405.1 hypothetical protein F502_02932 [Clostridium pasteurianum DSM 525 = ATCC 6013]